LDADGWISGPVSVREQCNKVLPKMVSQMFVECQIIYFHFLFLTDTVLSQPQRYPDRIDCPDNERAVNPENEDEPWQSSSNNYFFPDFSRNSCAYGRDYPTWMGDISFEKHYLFRQGVECCTKYFPTASGCPYENATQAQTGYYWTSYQANANNTAPTPIQYNHTFYPDITANACMNG
jgi:hypothetical protein